jgi:predicted ATPase
MKLKTLTVRNFRAIAELEITDLPDAVVLAGPNGCGKSVVLDAIRLLKSAYGSYQQDEWQTWFGEFQISLNKEPRELLPLFQNQSKDLVIAAEFTLNSEEQTYLLANAKQLLTDKIWREIAPQIVKARSVGALALAAHQRTYGQDVEARIKEQLPEILDAIKRPSQVADLKIVPLGGGEVKRNLLLELVMSTYEPQQLGVIDYHGPNRNYNRERLGSINLTIESTEDRLRQHALYNYANKYANLKAEMASAFIRHMLGRTANPELPADDALTGTLKELFATFFPGKEFLGPQPTEDGRLLFPVRLANGSEHDIDELSSGEKEVLYGYLRLHNAAPRHSIILIDEPELHLNPRLVSGLAAFYYRHLGDRLDNQLWLVTHSDTLIREAVSQPKFGVFHIHPAGTVAGSQARPVKAAEDLERVVIDLVGDLAAYRPGAKVVVFESTDDAAFDMRMTCSLFPDFEQQVNAISAGDKRRVADLYELLEKAWQAGHVHARFYAITDADDEAPIVGPAKRFRWDVYHIENYLLHPAFVLDASRAIGIGADVLKEEKAVSAALQDCAGETIAALVSHRLRISANRTLVSAIDLRSDPQSTDPARAVAEAIERSNKRIQDRLAGELSQSSLAQEQLKYRNEYASALADGSWVVKFRGRDILARFAGRHVPGMRYEYFRDLIINRMSEAQYRPSGMEAIVQKILTGN